MRATDRGIHWTGTGAPMIESTGMTNPADRAKWAAAGITREDAATIGANLMNALTFLPADDDKPELPQPESETS